MSVKDKPMNPHHHTHQPEDDDDPYIKMLERSGCIKQHYKLQDCYFEHNSDWRKCQEEMKEFKECMNKHHQTKKKL